MDDRAQARGPRAAEINLPVYFVNHVRRPVGVLGKSQFMVQVSPVRVELASIVAAFIALLETPIRWL